MHRWFSQWKKIWAMLNCQVWSPEAIPLPDDFWILPHSTCSFLSHPFGIHLTSVDRGEKGDEARGRRKRWETKGRWQEGVSWTQKSRFDCNMIAAKMVEFQQFKAEIYPVPISQKSRCCWVHLCIVMQHEHHMLFKSREARLRDDSESSDKDHWSWLTWYTLW